MQGTSKTAPLESYLGTDYHKYELKQIFRALFGSPELTYECQSVAIALYSFKPYFRELRAVFRSVQRYPSSVARYSSLGSTLGPMMS